MTRNIAISIIIPAYNAERTIIETINSILCSAGCIEGFELIIVDDGSDIDLGSLLYSNFSFLMDSNIIRCFKQRNKGVSVARNLGLSNSKGDYITFCDADDLVCDNYILKLLEVVKSGKDVEIYEFGFKTFNYSSHLISDGRHISSLIPGVHSSNNALNSNMQVFIWLVMCRLIRRDLAISVSFPEGIKYCEDFIYLIEVYKRATKIGKLDDFLYYYRMGHDSAISKLTLHDVAIVENVILKSFEKNNPTYNYALAHIFYMYHSASKRKSKFFSALSIYLRKKPSILVSTCMFRNKFINLRKFLVLNFPIFFYLTFKFKRK